jgi:hypothetical protein
MRELTPTELRLVEQYVRVLDYVSRCAQAIDHGDWYYLADKAGALASQTEQLATISGELQQAIRQGRHYRAARLLHPAPEGRR